MSDMVSVPAEKIAALREAWGQGEWQIIRAARALVDAVETERCQCVAGPDYDGPREDCPIHGGPAPVPVTPARDDAETAIAGLLAEHTPTKIGSRYMCRCEGVGLVAWDEHRAHLASVIAAHMAAPDELAALRQRVAELEGELDSAWETVKAGYADLGESKERLSAVIERLAKERNQERFGRDALRRRLEAE